MKKRNSFSLKNLLFVTGLSASTLLLSTVFNAAIAQQPVIVKSIVLDWLATHHQWYNIDITQPMEVKCESGSRVCLIDSSDEHSLPFQVEVVTNAATQISHVKYLGVQVPGDPLPELASNQIY